MTMLQPHVVTHLTRAQRTSSRGARVAPSTARLGRWRDDGTPSDAPPSPPASLLAFERAVYLQRALGVGGVPWRDVEAFRTSSGTSYIVQHRGDLTRVVRVDTRGVCAVFEQVRVGAQRPVCRAPMALLHRAPSGWTLHTTSAVVYIARRADLRPPHRGAQDHVP